MPPLGWGGQAGKQIKICFLKEACIFSVFLSFDTLKPGSPGVINIHSIPSLAMRAILKTNKKSY